MHKFNLAAMSAEQISSLLDRGVTKNCPIPVDHLDYAFIEYCTDVKYLERILRVLRSGEEGLYPHLTEFCEKHIEKLDPRSRTLRKDQPPATAASFSSEEWSEIANDLKNWTNEVKQNEAELKHLVVLEDVENVPPVRGSNFSVPLTQNNPNAERTNAKKRVAPRDYREWDTFDPDEECAKIDGMASEKSSPAIIHHALPKLKRKIDTAALTEHEKRLLSNHEKEKGNEAFRAMEYEEAVEYYSRSLSVLPSVVVYNNRAQAQIKLQHWRNALNDCQKVLEQEPRNLKALLRRATVYKHMGDLKPAADDLKNILEAEPWNLTAKNLLLEVKERMTDCEPEEQRRGKRLFIQDVDEPEEAEEGAETSLHVGGEIAASAVQGEMGNAQRKFPSRGDWGPQTEEKPSFTGKKERGKAGSAEKDRAQGDRATEQKPVNGAQENGSCAGDQSSVGGSGAESSRPEVSTGSLPPTLATLKSQGNQLFKNGQFADALVKYTEAINGFTEAGVDSPADLSILYSNRAACSLKDGNCSDCIQDCTRALELQPFSIKPLLRRAMAYESLERYRQAYVDYKTVLQIDSGVQAANDSVNRISRLLIEQDGHNWREKLPEIPVVPLSEQHRREESASSSEQRQERGHSKPVQDTGKKLEAHFLSLKQEGNDFVKNGQYKAAIGKYSECLKLKPEECMIYTNRALCYLKLNQFVEAKQDCDSTLQFEPSNKKAFYRRALAYKGLQDYAACCADLQEVLRLDPSVQEAEKELQEARELLRQESPQDKHRRTIPIQEVNDSDEEESEITADTSSATDGGELNYCAARQTFPSQPTNAYEFGQALNAARSRGDAGACAELLSSIEPEKLPSFMSNKLDGDVFNFIIKALYKHLLQKDPDLVYQHLSHLHEAERFKVVLLLLDKSDHQQITELFEQLSRADCDEFTVDDLQHLANKYVVS
ncbi:sperm-associated antigen 1 isoform X3 [Amia ocellicauda]|uniref:sperm-associated antigen 1 isoform X3 n=1 Tax=Amia ocellicauda TaxID=2972642 RepID=UPI0034645FBB